MKKRTLWIMTAMLAAANISGAQAVCAAEDAESVVSEETPAAEGAENVFPDEANGTGNEAEDVENASVDGAEAAEDGAGDEAADTADSSGEENHEPAETEEEIRITLSDEEILVNGNPVSKDASEAVYAGAEIVYYKEGQDALYGEGDESDGHSPEEAVEHTVLTITQPGTYRVSGSISKGQIAVDLGESSREDETAVVKLILDNADITCTVAPAVVVYNAYECGSDDTETASKDVDTEHAGFRLILADDSENTVNGSHVAKIYKEGTTQEEVDAGEAKKAWKFDAAIDSLVSVQIDTEEAGTGKLKLTSDNEGIESSLHLTINGGEIDIQAADDALNASEDGVSVITINGGTLTCNSGLGKEGDGIDSNGWIVINGGMITAGANGESQDSGLDSDLGIYINGGTVLGSGNMYDEVSADSAQQFVVLGFAEKTSEDETLLLKNSDGEAEAAFSAVNPSQILVYSSPELTEGDYTLYKVDSVEGTKTGSIYTDISGYEGEAQLQYSSTSMMGGPGMFGGRPGSGHPEFSEGAENRERPELPEGAERGERSELPEGAEHGERPELPEGAENGERPELPEEAENGDSAELSEGAENGDSAELSEGAENREHPGLSEEENGENPEAQGGAESGGISEGLETGEDSELSEKGDTIFRISTEHYLFVQITAL